MLSEKQLGAKVTNHSLTNERKRITIKAKVGATIKAKAIIWFHSRSLERTMPSPIIVITRNTYMLGIVESLLSYSKT